ncbi:hypothetical protein [Acidovorax sp. Root402]|jgi:hypothetical protein|uniref:hypothetical protein n=1 Tax=Acidovorax sp. Root402 TaxID=1736527 RepID=UPI0006FC00A5|nr:hypothetical protein [Acidovorax sp. Root402]KQW21685.1 hypothetical protein ASC83_17575 [Acidovorax sp. Root402]
MTPKQWPDETKSRAEKAMSDLEAFWSNFRNSTQAGRRDLLPLLTRIRLAVVSASQSDAYVLDRLAKLQDACKQLSRIQQRSSFEEDAQIVFALGDLSMIRSQLQMIGLVEDEFPSPP